ncbi:MAG: response regulator transcription factor [Butyrivibrio sp.]|nr:response regulator transcription factor [Butyrivibrio sp.]
MVNFSVGICDDDPKCHRRIIEICEKHFAGRSVDYQIHSYHSGEEVIKEQENYIDLLFLDVEMEGIDGIKVMQKAEKMPNIHSIVFVSAHAEAVWDSFGYKTKGFIQKPVDPDKIRKFLEAGYENKKNDSFIDFPNYNGSVFYKKSEIIYVKSDSNYAILNLGTHEKIITCTLKECEKKLGGIPFLRVHRSFIVNLDHIKNITGETVCFKNGSAIRIGRSYRESVKKGYTDYLLGELQR